MNIQDYYSINSIMEDDDGYYKRFIMSYDNVMFLFVI